MSTFKSFLQLHNAEKPLLIGNAWDVASARIFEEAGLQAIATSSAALANVHGYKDGENIPFDVLVQSVLEIKKAINVPLSVDLEAGFSRSIRHVIENIERLHDIGVVGINIEDSLKTNGTIALQPVTAQQHVISAIAGHLAKRNMHVFINARTDAFVAKMPDALEETIARLKLYDSAGANGIFVPFLSQPADIAAIVASTTLPLNVFALPALPGFTELTALGVKRISMGTAVFNAVKRHMLQAVDTVIKQQSFNCLY